MKPVQIGEEDYHDHVEGSDGICLSCGEWKYGDCEPDAENYRCDECGAMEVMGVEMAMVAGHIQLVEDDS